MMKIINTFLVLLLLTSSNWLYSQDDLLDILDKEIVEEPVEVAYSFKSTRIINSHTIERMTKQQLDFRVNHRFGELNSGYENFWGLDNALISLDFGYGINDWLMVGLRRSTYNKTIDGSLKFSILRQTTGSKNIPVALSYYTNIAADGRVNQGDAIDSIFSYRLGYTHQLLVARKFNETFTLQLMPTYVHRNYVDYNEENDIFSVGLGGRVKLTRRLSMTFEYFWASHATNYFDKQEEGVIKYYNPISVGFDLETGGHVFQMFISNTRMMEETGFIAETTSNPLQGELYFGFNISRVFALGGHKKQE